MPLSTTVADWLQSAGLGHLRQAFVGVTPEAFRSLMMQVCSLSSTCVGRRLLDSCR